MAEAAIHGDGRAGYSDAYDKLILDDGDLVGSLAYAIYKKQKREFITRNGLAHDDKRVRDYHHDLQDARVEGLRQFAESQLQEYASKISAQILDAEREAARAGEIVSTLLVDSDDKRQVIQKELDALSKQIRTGTAWWKNILWSVIGGFRFALVLTAAAMIQWTNPFGNAPPAMNESPQTRR
jgi:glutaredoxin 2